MFAAHVSLMLRPGVIGGGCSGTHTGQTKMDQVDHTGQTMFEGVDQFQSYDDLSMRDLVEMMNQAESDEVKQLDQEILNIVYCFFFDLLQRLNM